MLGVEPSTAHRVELTIIELHKRRVRTRVFEQWGARAIASQLSKKGGGK